MRLTASIVRDFAGLAAIEPDWLDLIARMEAPPPSILPGWSHGLMARHAGDDGSGGGGEFRILAIAADGRLALCFPYLVARRRRRCDVRAACEIAPVAIAAPDDGALLTRLLVLLTALHGRHRLRFDHLDAARPEVARLLALARRHYRSVETLRTDANGIVDLSDGWRAARARLSPNAREALRRAHARTRSLALDGSFEVHDGVDRQGSVFAALLEIDALSWKHARGGAMIRSDHEHVHFAFALARLGERGQVRIFLQRLSGRPAAFVIAFVVGERAYLAIWSYADAYSACSPGRLAMEATLRQLAAEGIRTVDLWGRNDAFKSGWSPATVSRTTLVFHSGRRAPESMRAALSTLRAIATGPRERHRLKRDDPGIVRRMVARWRALFGRRPASRSLRLMPSDRRPVLATCKALTEPDKRHLPRRSTECPATHVFQDAEGTPIATARIVAAGRRLHVGHLEPSHGAADDLRDCAAALLSAFPDARRIAEPALDLALRDGSGIIAAIVAARVR